MRPAKIPGEVVYQKVWASLCERMDPEMHRVRPSWLTMMRKIGVCRQRIAVFYNALTCPKKCLWLQGSQHGTIPKVRDYSFRREGM